jgi:hypothetical protein
MRQPRQGGPPNPYFPADFYQGIAREIDPDQSLTDEALLKLNQLADEFVHVVMRDCAQFIRSKEDPQERGAIAPEDVHYVLQTRFGMSLSGASGPVPSPAAHGPTEEYKEKLRTVREFVGREE